MAKFKVTLQTQTYYIERAAITLEADTREQAEKDALKYVKKNRESMEWGQECKTSRPRFAVENVEVIGEAAPAEAAVAAE